MRPEARLAKSPPRCGRGGMVTRPLVQCRRWNEMKYRSVDHGPAVSLAAIAILIVISAAALKYLGS
jgi:hypothetical protein